MSKVSPFKLQKHTVRLIAGDFEELGVLFPEKDSSDVLRKILHDFIAKVKAADKEPSIQVPEVSL